MIRQIPFQGVDCPGHKILVLSIRGVLRGRLRRCYMESLVKAFTLCAQFFLKCAVSEKNYLGD